MVKCAKENKIILLALAICLFFTLAISTGCKKKEPSEQARQDVYEEKTKNISASWPTDMTEKIDLRILYAGLPDTERAKDFIAFLSKHFTKLETTDYNTFTGNEALNYDVAIIDHNGVAFRSPRPKISRQYTGATVTMGVPGAFICSNLSLKTGYL